MQVGRFTLDPRLTAEYGFRVTAIIVARALSDKREVRALLEDAFRDDASLVLLVRQGGWTITPIDIDRPGVY